MTTHNINSPNTKASLDALDQPFLGKLVPQDQNDEPAPVLLKRIKTELVVEEPVKHRRKPKHQEHSNA